MACIDVPWIFWEIMGIQPTTIMVCNVFFHGDTLGIYALLFSNMGWEIPLEILRKSHHGGYFLGPDMGHICTQFGYVT